jgi:hypothetical protein
MYRFFSLIFLCAALFSLSVASPVRADDLDDVSVFIRSGNIKELAKHFDTNVAIKLLADEKVVSRAQAEVILSDFFSKYRPGSLRIVHKIMSNPNIHYAAMILNTSNGIFRTSITTKNVSGKFLISEIAIEPSTD